MSGRRDKKSTFDNVAKRYDEELNKGVKLSGESREYFVRGRIEHVAEFWKKHQSSEPVQIVDYGCGTGLGAHVLADVFTCANVIGIDPSLRSIESARQNYASERVCFFTATAGTRPCGTADLVHTSGVMHHVPVQERPEFLRIAAEMLRPGGILALFENNPYNPGTRLVMARIPFDRDAIPVPHWEATARMRDAGFLLFDVSFLFLFPKLLRVFRPLEKKIRRLPFGAQYGLIGQKL